MVISANANTHPGSFYRKSPSATSGAAELRKPDVARFFFHLQIAASVCRMWRGILDTLPEYKTRIIICLDQPSLPLKRLKAQVAGTNSLPLDVLVTRRAFDVQDNDEDEPGDFERSRVRVIMDLLSPLLPRIRSFSFNTKLSSSLPLISQDFHGPADQLRMLKLQSKVDDEWNYRFPDEEAVVFRPAGKKEFTFPNLATIALEGCTFLDACAVHSWTKQLQGMSIDSLNIARFTTPSRESDYGTPYHAYTFNLYMLMSRICDIGFIRHLTLQNISPEYDVAQFGEGYYTPNADNLTLRGLDPDLAEELNYVSARRKWCYYHLANIALDFESSVPSAHHLRLEKVSDSSGTNLKRALKRFRGRRLDIVNCKQLSDEHLNTIARNCKNMSRLHLVDCANITVEGVKAMVSTRRNVSSANLSTDDPGSDAEGSIECTAADDEKLNAKSKSYDDSLPDRIHHLHIEQHPTKLSDADRLWFHNSGVRSFSWA